MNMKFQRARLQTFIKDDDRRLNCTFVGREDIMADIMGTADAMARHNPQQSKLWPGKGRMRLIQGAPGIGKTSLLDSLNQRCHDRLRTNLEDNRPYVIPVMITSSNDLSPSRVAGRIRATINAVDRDASEKTLEDVVPDPPRDCALLLLIDEIQNVPGGGDPRIRPARC